MAQQNKPKWHELQNQVTSGSDPNTLLEILLALDRAVVEVSMHIYNLPAHERFVMREQNQRLHEAVREHLPRLREPWLLPTDC
jgi:hypothetical protein